MKDSELAESLIDLANYLEKERHLTLTAMMVRQAAQRLMEISNETRQTNQRMEPDTCKT